jgi:hypothetical protein
MERTESDMDPREKMFGVEGNVVCVEKVEFPCQDTVNVRGKVCVQEHASRGSSDGSSPLDDDGAREGSSHGYAYRLGQGARDVLRNHATCYKEERETRGLHGVCASDRRWSTGARREWTGADATWERGKRMQMEDGPENAKRCGALQIRDRADTIGEVKYGRDQEEARV